MSSVGAAASLLRLLGKRGTYLSMNLRDVIQAPDLSPTRRVFCSMFRRSVLQPLTLQPPRDPFGPSVTFLPALPLAGAGFFLASEWAVC